ncbi:hypothetical protein [Picosynechococcus sp. NKBG15041c]|uniref:hypothetical protein n=1 Tax=Picosynechococcus sp. NKBG15041c TaxID=1407650 RepID=UPI0003F6A06F|nr:hypothetical protein [Picosynechococcus sp. NKBG15041c]
MKFQTTLAYTLLLLLAMFGAGTVSALYGFTVGYSALQGVKQPEGNPSQKLLQSSRQNNAADNLEPEPEFVSERSIIVAVYDHIQAQEKNLQKQETTPADEEDDFIAVAEPETETSPTETATFPLKAQVADLNLEITKGEMSGNDWLMEVNIQNNGQESVNFLYNFLEVTSDDGRLLSTQTEGLPNEIPANRQQYSGIIRIPAVILEETKTLTLQLEDYPEREISLEIANIPVVR